MKPPAKAIKSRVCQLSFSTRDEHITRRMLLYALSACLWLIASAEDSILEDARVRFHKSLEPLPPNYLIAPEILVGRRTFLVLDYDEIPSQNQSPPRLRIQVRKYDDRPGVRPVPCTFDRTARYDTKTLGVSEFRRLSDDTFVFTWFDETSRGDRLTYIVYANMQTCRPFDFSPKDLRGKLLLVPSVNETFDVLVDDPQHCDRLGKRCRVSYDLKQNYRGINLPFNVSLDWSTLHVEMLPSGAYLIRGYENNTYNVMQMNRLTGEATLFSRITDKDRRMDFASSGTAFCWILDPKADRRTVYCEMADERGQIVLSTALKYDGPVSLVDVHPMKKEGELFVVTKREDCKNDADCWVLYGTKVSRNLTKFEHVGLNFPCTGDQRKLRIFDAVPDDEYGRMELHYACRNGNGYTFSTFFIY